MIAEYLLISIPWLEPNASAAVRHRLWPALAVTVGFAILARLLRAVDISGAVAGVVITWLLFISAGPGAFAAVAAVFALAFLTTRLGYRHKQFLGTAERRGGRTASQVLANLGMAGICGIASLLAGRPELWLLGLSAAMAEAAADTVSSEYGQARETSAYLITTWELVPAGTDGGISLPGTLAGIAASILLALICAAAGLVTRRWVAVVLAAGILGMFADSYLGAWLERRGRLNNDQVNFVSTVIAALLAVVLARSL
ncbi:MAG TPA: DUF92 domain-containing protein [Terriglobales bacterium]|nr:DUF92 domain-containing protein [Terriglobales bacterium]